MKLNKLTAVLGVALVLTSGTVIAASQGQGTVTFKGSIIDAPCSIVPDSADQTVDIGQVSSKVLQGGGTSSPQQFNIKLDGCALDTIKAVTAAFSGIADGNNLALQGGTAAGASIVIQDKTGKAIKINDATGSSPYTLTDGSNNLQFSAFLQGNGASTAVKTGDFTSVASFVLAYQ
ncbi:type 1 fimbrial protein [Serratia rubidaea]|uniref:fimbrial protein n=1 Tax=Serratia rubidaea TaxID=61652 RepID=UPI001F419705|nr:fimbrial protein [Serratia rubidaea]UJD79461.1 type 1 fimbrial protein [Serratia rubidaea]UJD84016.1 type 1 fimbrial protein [Serratia rubidaea]